MKSRILQTAATVGLAVVIGAGALWAGERAEDKKQDSEKQTQVAAPAEQERRVDYTLEGLSHAMDLWYDAILKGDQALAGRYEKLLDNVLTEDISAAELACDRLEKKSDSDRMQHARVECQQETDRVRLLIQEKKELARQIRAGASFDEKYRRLGIYINLLRRELGMPKVKFAEVPVSKK